MSIPAQGAVGAETMTAGPKMVLLPMDDPSQPLHHSGLPSAMIRAGGDAFHRLKRDHSLVADSCSLAVGIYRAMTEAHAKEIATLTPPAALASPRADSDQRTAGEALKEACKPWEHYTGEPPDDGSPLSGVFVAGMVYTERLLAKLLDVTHYEGGDGSEDFDADATQTLRNILTGARLWDADENRPVSATPAQPAGAVPDSLRALSEAASPGEATFEIVPYHLGDSGDADLPGFLRLGGVQIAEVHEKYGPGVDPRYEADGKFVAAAINFVRTLLASHPAGQSAGSGEDEIVSARLTAWRDGHGGVDIAFASGRRIAIALDAPHVGAPTAMLKARNARLGETAGLGDLPNRIFAFLMDGRVHEVSDLYHLIKPGEDHKKVWNAVSYLNRRGSIVKLKRGQYQIGREFFLGAPAPDSTRTGQGEDWRDDPSADVRWNAGLVYGHDQLCRVLGVDPGKVSWDAATETLDGDVQSVICNILRAWAGDDWQSLAARPSAPEAQGAWLPIETAPQTNEDVLVAASYWDEAGTERRYTTISSYLDQPYRRGFRHRNGAKNATDWMPLPEPTPAPPASSGQGGR